ncbi:MAG: TolC family protein [Chlorobiaceae bacterium]|nr:TolC family protein [Chlorobiaceae bacterium]
MKSGIIFLVSLLLSVFFSTGTAFSAENKPENSTVITLDDAIQLARGMNPKGKQAGEEVKAAQARVTEARSAFFPQITAKAGYRYLDPVSEINMFGNTLQFMPHDNYDARITAQMLLFDFGGRGKSVDMAIAGRSAVEGKRDLVLRELSYATVRAFYAVLFLQDAEGVQEKEIVALQRNLDNIEKLYQAGIATRFDILSTQVRLEAARNRKIDLQTELENQRLNIRRLCGLNDGVSFELKGSFDTPSLDAESLKPEDDAVHDRPELRIARENLRAASFRKSAAASEGLPKVYGMASWGTANGYQPDINEMRRNIAAGVELQVPLFTGFRTQAATRESAALMRAAEQEQLDTEEMVKTEISQSLNTLRSSKVKIGTTALQYSQAELAARQARIRFQNGIGTTLDLLDAEAKLAEAELAGLKARYDYVVNVYAFRRAAGDLLDQ